MFSGKIFLLFSFLGVFSLHNFLKFLLLAIPVLSIGIMMSIQDRNSIEDDHFSGIVRSIEWKSRNHEMPLIFIRNDKGRDFKFHHYRIALKPDQLKVGDHIAKEKGSLMCLINDKEFKCVYDRRDFSLP